MKLNVLLWALATSVTLAITSTTMGADAKTAAGLFDQPEHLTRLKLDRSGAKGWSGILSKTEKPAALFYAGEPANIDIQLKGVTDSKVTVEVVQVGFDFGGFNTALGDPAISGQVNIIAPRGETKRLEVPVTKENGRTILHLKNLPTEKYGLYAVIVEPNGKGRQAVATVARGFKPRENVDRWSNPIMYSRFFELPAAELKRIGYQWVRTDGFPNWNGADGGKNGFDWGNTDREMRQFKDNGLYIMSNMYGSPDWTKDATNTKAYHMVHTADHDKMWGDFVEEAVRRYCGPDGTGPLQIIDYYNEPWEGGGISGWNADAVRYRELYKIVYERAHKGSPHIVVGGASSIMNTEDKFFAYDSGTDWSKMFDVLTDHYVLPSMVYGPRVAKRMGIYSIETETWLGYTEKRFIATVIHFMAAGQKMVNPNYPSQLTWSNSNAGTMLKPPALSANVLLHYIAGRPFERVVFTDHLPWLYQFGKGKDAVFVLAGDMTAIEDSPTRVMYGQIMANGTMTFDTLGGKLVAHDIWGNPYPTKGNKVEVPVSSDVVWITGTDLEEAQIISAIKQGTPKGIKPVEMVLHDFTAVPGTGTALNVEIHNVLNVPVSGTLTVDVPGDIKLAKTSQPVTLAAGQRQTVAFAITQATPAKSNMYAVKAAFNSEAGKANLEEMLSANVIVKGTPTLDGDLADWAKVPAVTVVTGAGASNSTLRAWRPWEEQKDIRNGLAEFRVMTDANYLYISVRERNPGWRPKPRLSTRNDEKYFGDTPGTKHTYRNNNWSPNSPDPTEALPFSGNCLQIGIGLGLGGEVHKIPDPTNIPMEMEALPTNDYEYAVWGAPDGESEIWRSAYPGGPRVHFYPRILPRDKYDGVPAGAKAIVKKVGSDVIYEIALPLKDMKALTPEMLAPGKSINLTFRLGGTNVVFGSGKSATRDGGLALLPHWLPGPTNTISWGVVDSK